MFDKSKEKSEIVSYKNTDYSLFHLLWSLVILKSTDQNTTNLRKHSSWNSFV